MFLFSPDKTSRYLINVQEKSTAQLTQGKIQPKPPELNSEILQNFVQKYPIVLLIKLQYAFNFADYHIILAELEKAGIAFKLVGDGHFVRMFV